MKYQLRRKCKDCNNEDLFEFSKIQAAFELYDINEIWNTKCSNCNSINCASIIHPHVKLDKEILDFWGNNEKLYLNPQDEEIILAEMHYLPLIIESISEGKYLKQKNNILIESLCILLYDNTIESDEFTVEENIERDKNAKIILPKLFSLKNKILESENNIMDYVKVIVFPQIGLKL